jgi:eukaryotic-like serine/threonine-protein kinase
VASAAPSGRFERLRRLGEGANGVVYEALDRERGTRVALKALRFVTAQSLAELKREFRAMQGVHHPNLVSLGDLVVEDDECFFTMDLVEGVDFLEYVRPTRSLVDDLSLEDTNRPSAHLLAAPIIAGVVERSFDEGRLRQGLRQLAEALFALHAAGLVHRDVKPSNVRVTPDGRVVLLDFGLVVSHGSNTWTQETAGTPAYMAPEQATAANVGPEADWYALGVLLFEAMTNTFPFVGTSLDIMMQKQREEAPAPSAVADDVPPDLDALSAALMRRDSATRPKGYEVLLALGGALSSGSRNARGSQTQTAPFVGRLDECAALSTAFHDSRNQPVTVLVEGESGVGKTALVQRFLHRLAHEVDNVVVLAGRCYERDSVPFKAFDGIVDALARILSRLPDEEAQRVVPTKPAPLVKVFPVLRRVAAIAEQVRGTPPLLEPHELRVRAFAALRELFTRLGDRRPLVLVIDDAQWADTDSLALLAELLRPPEAPRLLLVMTARGGPSVSGPPEPSPPSPAAERRRPTLASTLRWEVRRIGLGALPPGDASALATELLDRAGVVDPQLAAWSARQAGGHPLFIDMMTRQAERLISGENGSLALEDVLWGIIGQLEETSLAILETVCVADAPMPQEAVARAAGVEWEPFAKAVSLLRASHMVQTRGTRNTDRIEPYHDRVRMAVLAHLEAARRVEVHRRIALTLEATQPLDPESLVVHWRGAGDPEQTVRFAGLAGDRAADALAFDRAAIFYELALTGHGLPEAERRTLLVKLGEARANAGRGESAAEAFGKAALGAGATEVLELRRREAEELMMAGDIDAGAMALHRVLATVDMHAPQSPLAALLLLIVYSLWQAVLGLRFKERTREEVPRGTRARVDALFAVSLGFAVVDILLSRCMGMRHLITALRVGDTFQILRAAALEMSSAASAGGPVGKREHRLLAIAQRLAEREENREGKGFLRASLGVRAYLRGDWKKAREHLDTAYTSTDSRRPGWQSNANVFAVWTLHYLGELREVARRRASLLADADARGDLYTSVQLRDGSVVIVELAADDPETARRHIRESIAQWSHTRFLLQHWHAMYGETDIELYLGNGARAHERCMRDLPAIGRSLLLKCEHIRIFTKFTRGRSAVASAGVEPTLRRQRLAEARRMASELERELPLFAGALASLVSAAVSNAEGNRPAAIAWLRRAIGHSDAAHMAMYAAAARYQLGSLLGNEEGKGLLRDGGDAMKAQDVRVPARLAGMWLPGRWGGA